MKKLIIPLVLIVLIAVIVFMISDLPRRLTGSAASVIPTDTPTALPPAKVDREVLADARVVPVQSADMSMPTSGIVSEILVQEGDQVKANQVLLRLNAARQRANLAQAEAQLRRAQAGYEEIAAGSREQEITAAKASVDAAMAQLQKLQQGPKAEDIEAAQAALAAAQADLRKAAAGPNSQELIAAKAELDNADAARRQAQAAYDRVRGSPDIGRLPESLALEKATNDYNAALARYQALQRGADPAEVAAARARVDQAQAELNRAKAPPNESDIAAAEAEVRRAQAQLDLLLAGPRSEEIAAALADVSAAEAAVEEAKAAVSETELVAPFDGEIVSLDVILGQQVAVGQTVLRMADFTSWRIETNDLTELDVVGILPGDPVVITFDAIPGLELPGTVLRIKTIGETRQGDITYTVTMLLDESDDRLLWNMTSTVRISPGAGLGMAPQMTPQKEIAPATAIAAAVAAGPLPEALGTPTALLETTTLTVTLAAETALAVSPSPLTSTLGLTTTVVTSTAPIVSATAVELNTASSSSVEAPTNTPEPTATPSASPSATATAQPSATPTDTATLTATPTNSPVPTQTPTARPVLAATATPTARSVAAPTPTVRRVATPRPTATPRLVVSSPELVFPESNATVNGNVFFRWRPTGTLPATTAYEVVWWNTNENPALARGIAPPTTLTSLTANLDVLYANSQFTNSNVYWTVLIVQTDPYVRLTQPGQSNVGLINYQPGGQSGSPINPRP